MKSILPDTLSALAFRASNGELAWQREQLSEVIGAYARLGHAVEAFEVWLVDDVGKWTGLIPIHGADVPTICVYDVEGRKSTETREAFVTRCAQEILQKIDEWDIERNVDVSLRSRIRYNLYVPEEFAEQGAASNADKPRR